MTSDTPPAAPDLTAPAPSLGDVVDLLLERLAFHEAEAVRIRTELATLRKRLTPTGTTRKPRGAAKPRAGGRRRGAPAPMLDDAPAADSNPIQ